MKGLIFFFSLVVHLLLLLLVVHMQFPIYNIDMKPQVIQIVPMSPPLPAGPPLRAPAFARPLLPQGPVPGRPGAGIAARNAAPQAVFPARPVPAKPSPPAQAGRPAPVPVYVRPFVLKGGAPGGAQEGNSARKSGTPAEVAAGPGPSRPAPGAEQPTIGSGNGTATAAPGSSRASEPASGPRLSIDLNRWSRQSKGNGASGGSASGPGFGAGSEDNGVPFDASGAFGVGGDGTTSHALGGNAYFDSRGYDITPWAKRMVYRVKKNWIFPPISQYKLKGAVGIYMLIDRDGNIVKLFVRKSSGIRPFDQAAFSAIQLAAPLPPLPDDYPRADLPAYLLFFYR
jgi:TonB family protein